MSENRNLRTSDQLHALRDDAIETQALVAEAPNEVEPGLTHWSRRELGRLDPGKDFGMSG